MSDGVRYLCRPCCSVVLGSAPAAFARLEGVNNPQMLPPGPPQPVLDVAGKESRCTLLPRSIFDFVGKTYMGTLEVRRRSLCVDTHLRRRRRSLCIGELLEEEEAVIVYGCT